MLLSTFFPTVMLKFEDLLSNDASASSYLSNILGIPKTVVTSIMNATVSQDWVWYYLTFVLNTRLLIQM